MSDLNVCIGCLYARIDLPLICYRLNGQSAEGIKIMLTLQQRDIFFRNKDIAGLIISKRSLAQRDIIADAIIGIITGGQEYGVSFAFGFLYFFLVLHNFLPLDQ